MKTITVLSTHGFFAINGLTGNVVNRNVADDILKRIVRFNLAEWRSRYGCPSEDHIDILDLGYWLDDGTYEPPDETWRKVYVATFGKPRNMQGGGQWATAATCR